MEINITKCHGSGNDFILVDAIGDKIHFREEEYVAFTQKVCNRKGKIGADGTLFLLPSKKADVKMRIFNADGSEPEMCGNGIRCLARKAHEILDKDAFTVETMKAVLTCHKEKDIFRGVYSFSVLIDNVSFISEDFPFVKELPFINRKRIELSEDYYCSTISLGNPHLVIKKADFTEDEVEKMGILANSNKTYFPKGINVSFFKKIKPQTIFVQTFERGVGITHSCGTAMSASSIVSCILEDCTFNTWIDVYNKGGLVRCYIEKNKDEISAKLLGNATFTYTARVGFTNGVLNHITKRQAHTSEIGDYENLIASCKNQLTK